MAAEAPRAQCTVSSPLGMLVLTASGTAVTEVRFASPGETLVTHSSGEEERATLRSAAAELRAWFEGQKSTLDFELLPSGTEFQRAVWAAVRSIPFGETRTYGDIARALGRPLAARAVGAANGANPIAIAIPCHRVVGANGSLTGYAFGVHRKRWLLDHERARRTRDSRNRGTATRAGS